jgi:hypothetical protein
MTSFKLKILAYIAMISDHFGLMFLLKNTSIFNVAGRISFPIFAFLIAEGSRKTRNVNKYILRLFIFAIISQPFYMYFHKIIGFDIYSLNIFFTLTGGLILLVLLKKKRVIQSILFFIFIILINKVVPFDFEIYGILLIPVSYILLIKRNLGILVFICITLLESWRRYLITDEYPIQIFALLSLIPMLLYNNKIGLRLPRLVFYSIYPLHLLILSIIFLSTM